MHLGDSHGGGGGKEHGELHGDGACGGSRGGDVGEGGQDASGAEREGDTGEVRGDGVSFEVGDREQKGLV